MRFATAPRAAAFNQSSRAQLYRQGGYFPRADPHECRARRTQDGRNAGDHRPLEPGTAAQRATPTAFAL